MVQVCPGRIEATRKVKSGIISQAKAAGVMPGQEIMDTQETEEIKPIKLS